VGRAGGFLEQEGPPRLQTPSAALKIPAAAERGGVAGRRSEGLNASPAPRPCSRLQGKADSGRTLCPRALRPSQDQVPGWTPAHSTHGAGEGRGCFLLRKTHPVPLNRSPHRRPLPGCSHWLRTSATLVVLGPMSAHPSCAQAGRSGAQHPTLAPSAKAGSAVLLWLQATASDSHPRNIFRRKSTELESSGEGLAPLALTKQVCLGSVPVGGRARGRGDRWWPQGCGW